MNLCSTVPNKYLDNTVFYSEGIYLFTSSKHNGYSSKISQLVTFTTLCFEL